MAETVPHTSSRCLIFQIHCVSRFWHDCTWNGTADTNSVEITLDGSKALSQAL